MKEDTEEILLRVCLSIDLVIFSFNLLMSLYIMTRMMIPQKIRFALLWTFYVAVVLVSVLEIGLMIFLLTEPSKIASCYIYGQSIPSIVHNCICSCVAACGLICAATMH